MPTTFQPNDPNGYGTGIASATNGDASLSLLSGVPWVMDCIIVRLTTPSLWYAPGWGYDLSGLVNAMTSQTAQQITVRAQQEILKDERVSTVTANSSFDGNGNFTLTFNIVLAGRESFTLIGTPIASLGVSQLQFVGVTNP